MRALSGSELQRGSGQLMSEPFALLTQFDGDRPQQSPISVHLQRSGSDDLFPFSGNKHRREMLIDACEREMKSIELPANLR